MSEIENLKQSIVDAQDVLRITETLTEDSPWIPKEEPIPSDMSITEFDLYRMFQKGLTRKEAMAVMVFLEMPYPWVYPLVNEYYDKRRQETIPSKLNQANWSKVCPSCKFQNTRCKNEPCTRIHQSI